MKKILNPEIKKYIVNFAADQLENCYLFTKTFGRGFAKQKLDENIENVYTNEKSKINSGCYNFEDKSVTICESGKNDSLLKPEDMQTIEDIEEIILHECIHAILNKNKVECKKLNIKWGSGLLEKYYNNSELGRGLNEGLTNWIVEKTGIKTTSYEKFTDFIKQLEIYIGSNKVMNLGKGGIHKNIHRYLKMSKSNAMNLLLNGDEYYNLYEVYNNIDIISEILKENKRENGTIHLDEKALEELSEVRYDFYTNPEKYINYRNFLNRKDLQDTIENKLQFCEEYITSLTEMLDYQEITIDSILFDTYFKNKFESIKNNIDKVSIKEFKKILSLENLINSGNSEDNRSSAVFKREIEEFKGRFLENQTRKINAGAINKKEFLEIIDMFYSDEFSDNNLHNYKSLFINAISKSIYPKNINVGNELIETLIEKRDIDEINRYSFQEIKSKDGQSICLYYKDGKLEFTGNSHNTKIMSADTKIDESEEIVDYTIELDVKETNIIKNFLSFKESIKKRDPKAKISISNKAIIVEPSKEANEEKAFFMISGEDIVPAIPVENDKTKIDFMDDKRSLALAIRKSNPITNFLKNIKKFKDVILRNNDNDFNNSDTSNTVFNVHHSGSEENKFNSELKNFKPIEINSNTHKKKDVSKKNSNER